MNIKGGTNSISVSGTIYGAAATYTIPLNAAYSFVFTGGIWYCFLTTDLAQMANVLPVANGGTGTTTSTGGGSLVLSAAPTISGPVFTNPGGSGYPGQLLLSNGTISGATGQTTVSPSATTSVTMTMPASSDTLVGRATTDTLTNKSISGTTNTISNVSLNSAVIGTLPVTNGGTGYASNLGLQNNQNASSIVMGFAAETYDIAAATTNVSAVSTSTSYFHAVYLIAGQTFQTYNMLCSSAGSSGTISFGLYYSASGSTPNGLVTGTNYSATGSFVGTTLGQFTLGSAVTIPATGVYFIGFSSTGGGTLVRSANSSALYVSPLIQGNINNGFQKGLRFGTASSATLTSSYTSTSITPAAYPWWVGLS